MKYKAVIIDYAPKARLMAAAAEEKANEMAALGYELVTMSITNTAKAILIFKTDEEAAEDGMIESVEADSVS